MGKDESFIEFVKDRQGMTVVMQSTDYKIQKELGGSRSIILMNGSQNYRLVQNA
jgi:hypothetical protein